jgi:hypothetical protein
MSGALIMDETPNTAAQSFDALYRDCARATASSSR